MKETIKVPIIPEIEKSALVRELLLFIEQQASIIQQLSEETQKLRDEIARLKKQPPKPNIKPSSLGKKRKRRKTNLKTNDPGQKKRKKQANWKFTIP